MGNNTSSISAAASAMSVAAKPCGIVACTNLRQLPDRSGLVPVGRPPRVAPYGYRPMSVNRRSDGSYRLLVLSGGTTIGSVNPDKLYSYEDVVELPSRVDHTVPTWGALTLATADGSEYTFRYDEAADRWDVEGPMPELLPVVIRADDHAELSETVEPFTLSGTYPHCTEPVTAADKAALTTRLSAAVEALTAKASVARRCIHPQLMAYRLLDAEGRCLHTSVPVWVGPQEGGFGLCSMIGADIDRQEGGKCAVAAMTVAATAFRPVVVVPEQLSPAWARKVAALEILASPQLTAYRPGMQAGCRLRAVSQSAGRFEAYIPGASNGMVPTPENRADMVAGILDRFADTATVVAVVSYPFGGGFGAGEGEAVMLPVPEHSTAAGAASALDKALARSVPTVAPGSEAAMIAASAAPHSFSAGTMLQAADMVAYGNISVRRGRPPHAAFLAGAAVERVSQADAACHYVAVTFGDGSADCAVTADLAPSVLPVAVGPVVVYPDVAASRLDVAARGEAGAVTRLSLPLSRSRTGLYAYYIEPELKPVPLVADGAPLALPADSRSPRPWPGVVAVARSADPRQLLVAATASAHVVHRIVPAVRSASSWDFARQHLLVFASDGICSLSVNARRTSVAVNKLWPVGVVRPDAVTSAPDGVYAALAGGSLVRVTGSRIYPVDGGSGAVALAWSEPRGELWIVSGQGAVRVLDPATKSVYDRTFGPVLSIHDCGGAPYAMTAGGLFDINRETDNDLPVPVEWAVRMPVPYSNRPVALAVDMQSAGLDATLSLRADGGAGFDSSLPVTTLRMRGQVNTPLCLRLASPHRRYLTISLTGEVDPDTTISNYALTLKSLKSLTSLKPLKS